MFLWTKPTGLRVFRQSAEQARASSALAANQGLYNGFLAAGLFWSAFAHPPELAAALKVFFLCCVIVAGVGGAVTVSYRILLVQSLPAALALLAVILSPA